MSKYIYPHLIPENIAPFGATAIGVYDGSGQKVYQFPLGRLTPPSGEKLYSFGLISDIHLQPASTYGAQYSLKFDNALTWFEEQGASFCCVTGDVTNHGFYNSDGTVDLAQFGKYKEICDLHPSLPVYATFGNHDSYMDITIGSTASLVNNLDRLKDYTGRELEDATTGKGVLYYRIDCEGDLFLFLGQPSSSTPMSDEALGFLEESLADSQGKRCFIFIHPCMRNDSGNALSRYSSNQYLEGWSGLSSFQALLRAHNTLLFHGHSHFQFRCQEVDECANYTDKNGYRSCHVPSLCGYRSCYDGETAVESLGYLVDVYADCIVLRGRDFGVASGEAMTDPCWEPIATYRINVAHV